MFGELGFDKLVLLLVLFLLLFGAKRIPEIARSLGKGIREFKGSLAGLDEPAQSPRLRDANRAPVEALLDSPVHDGPPLRQLNG
jgi:sec-independent protein translocase protein TatA